MILYEKEICQYMDIPSIPKKKWDGKKSFANGVAVIELVSGSQGYAVASYDADNDTKPRIKKVFSLEQYYKVSDIFVVPSYMDVDVENMDLDDESKESAQFLVQEADDAMEENVDPVAQEQTTYFFDNIHNDEEARAFIRAYNKKKKEKARVPKTHDGLIMRLSVIYDEKNN